MKFEKMHGAGNDYIYVNLFEERVDDPALLSRRLSDRHFGVGSDGLVLIGPDEEGDFSMKMFNADGSEGAMCGNAARCVGKYLYERGLTSKKEIALNTKSGIKHLSLTVNPHNNEVESVRVNMGKAAFSASDLLRSQVMLPEMIDYPVEIDGQEYYVTFVSMGNPHAVIFMQGIDDLEIEKIGPKIEHHPLFPKRTNVEFIEVIDRAHLKMRVWERGSGETMACGSGACASLVAGVITDRCDPKALLRLKGGILDVEWEKDNNQVFLIGDAHFVFKGEVF
ncbi:diaminopimelate epimerase [uncultured Proteiniphilum sp.]|uniref:diaminopimelate epimerase n=1 Tax=uncultured Proteiniphilum sp. TaxID=497637 RepID=UPI0026241208|nr:diaminopimelate epimerase [uncultured Proteiniphilum sp.]